VNDQKRPIEGSLTGGDADRRALLAAGLAELELAFRATLELRYRREMPDSTIAAVALLDEAEIVRQRGRALEWLAQRAGIEGPDAIETVEVELRSLSPAAWAGQLGPAEAQEVAPERDDADAEPEGDPGPVPLPPSSPPPGEPPAPKPFPTPVEKPSRSAARSRPTRRTLLLLLLAVVVVVGAVVLLSSGSDETTGPAGGGPVATKPPDPPAGWAAMRMLPGVEIDGEIDIKLDGDDLKMKLHGLPDPDGEYRAWLYSSVTESRSLGRARKGDGEINATLPDGWESYPSLDVSIQEPESIVHSGQSIARISTKDLP
jgi:hypothetical protein